MSQAHSRGSQRAERRRHREIKQQLEEIEEELWRLHHSPPLLLNALRLSDEPLRHASKTGDHHEGDATHSPTHVAASGLELPSRDTEARNCDDRRNDIAAPVHNVEDGTLDRGGLLTLNGLAERRCGSEGLRSRREGCERLPAKIN